MANKKTVKIDGEKLKGLIYRRGINLNDANRELGLSRTYISNACGLGVLPLYAAKLIESILNIPIADFEAKEEVKPVVSEKPAEHVELELIDIDYNKLYRCIYSAVIHALDARERGGNNNAE